MHKHLFIRILLLSLSLTPMALKAQPMRNTTSTTEERFQDLFVTAGYATAFGAAIGTACLAWTPNPSENLGYVAMGASIGFLSGAAFGTYVIFSPMMSDNQQANSSLLAAHSPLPSQGLVLRPTWDRVAGRLASIEGGMTLLNF